MLKMTGIFIPLKQCITYVCSSNPLGIIKEQYWYTTGL